ncbi:phospholipid-transporting ATPase ABCA3-like [Watersipora subatra]|uniref:phospholipid-transporting ATPase ABCA3-like n=1 Tax=Watersipora subatra TaxID=2589382 RepID=UPI00355C2BCB
MIEELNPNANPSSYSTLMERFPYPPYTDDTFLTAIQQNFPFFIMLCMIFFSLNIPKEVTLEKQNKLKESMRMMGMSNWLQWFSWFVKYFVFLLCTTFLMSLILCPPFTVPKTMNIFTFSSFSLIWFFLMMYSISIICYSFLISAIFSKANSAAAAGGVFFFLLYIPYSFISPRYDTLSLQAKLGSSIDFNLAMSYGMVLIGKFEGAGIGVQWNNLNQPVSVDDNLTFGQLLLMLFIDSVIYLIFMWYIEAVFPGPFGIPQKPYFLFLPSYWCGTRQNAGRHRATSTTTVDGYSEQNSDYFEEEPRNLDAGIEIRNLTKKFGSKKVAVNNLSLNMYDGQITALLGHNGAGKTTTMFMLTGFMPPTSGTAMVNGYDIRKDISSIRSSLGLCPQHDILFDNLTVEEHLYFFAKLKRCKSEQLKTEIDYYIKTLGLEEKRSSFASTLSGGQKRKLSVGIALIGDSKIVILDEPTSGMDPSARRHMWDVLQAQRAGRTMILSTHFMDEADHLGDRIAILADGVVQCCGSSLFLKKKYGAGYHMVMTKRADCDVETVNNLLKKFVPQAKLESNVGAELSYILPDDQVSAFPEMFSTLEKSKDSLGILGFGASVTTMEEVFMKVGNIKASDDAGDHDSANTGNYVRFDSTEPDEHEFETRSSNVSVVHEVEKNKGAALFTQQFTAMLIKRILYTLRNKKLTLSQIVLPLLFTLLTIIVLKTLPGTDGTAPKLPLSLDKYGKTVEYYSPEVGMVSNSVSSMYAKQFSSSDQQTAIKSDDLVDSIIDVAEKSMKEYNYQTMIAADYNTARNNNSNVTVFFNAQAYHSAPTALLYADNALLKDFVNDTYSFSAANHPLPQTTISKIQSLAKDSLNFDSFAYASNIMFGFSFLAASFVVFLITERSRKIKHSQIVSGVKWYNFWLSTFTWDLINYLIPALLTVCLYGAASVKNLSDVQNGNAQPFYVILLMLIYGMALLPNMYVLQYLFVKPATGYVIIVFYNLLTGTFPQLVITILQFIESTKEAAKQANLAFIVLLPNYNMGIGISNLYTNYQQQDLCYNQLPDALGLAKGKDSLDKVCKIFTSFPCCKDSCGDNCFTYQDNYLTWPDLGIGKPLFFLSLQAVIFWLIVVIIETEVLVKLFYIFRPKVIVTQQQSGDILEDDDVLAEKDKVLFNADAMSSEDAQVVISGLTKYYADHQAVDNVYLCVPQGECFGLLGVNGAGKTTTFRMLTGDETISGGTAFMAGKNVRTDIHDVQKSIGYCPQFDALIDQMTGEETLYMYARLRGIPEPSIPGIVDDLLKALLLNKHKKKNTKDYSGGNKRKLSTAIALIGNPPIVFLDEPTTGMDPVARRMLWETLTKVRDSGKTLILTSHSMEECEALCTRMAIMVNGKYRCLGSTQHLKNKFGAGYTLIARVSYPEDGSLPDIQAVQTFVEQNFPGSVLKDKHQNLVQYHIDKGELTWAIVFEKLEQNKAALNIEDYSVSQTTLEQVFINFARAQVEPDESKPGCTKRFRQTCCVCCIPEYIVDQKRPATTATN